MLIVIVARLIGKLKALDVSKKRTPGCYGDGGGLWLQVGPTGAKSWLFRYMLRGKAENMGIGPSHTVGLADARHKASEYRRLLADGIDPKAQRNATRAANQLAVTRTMTVRECAQAYIKVHRPGWKNAKHAMQWENTLRDYVFPTLGDLPIAAIDADLVIKCLSPIWTAKTETASRLRGRIESIIDWATTSKYRSGENPARWRGHLEHLLPAPSKVTKVSHHPALPYQEIAEFLGTLNAIPGVSALALRFTILTAARTSEVIGAKWDEIDFVTAVWTIPASRMKAGREHRVQLSSSAMAIVNGMLEQKQNDFVFPGKSHSKPMSNMALLMTLRRMERADLTVHGFRSTFRDWASEVSSHSSEVAEMALAHAVSDKVEAAYRRGDLLAKRRLLMEDWAAYCSNALAHQ